MTVAGKLPLSKMHHRLPTLLVAAPEVILAAAVDGVA